jgi:orotate phosphoribosyltransferase
LSATQEIQRVYDIPVISIINLDNLMSYLRDKDDLVLNLRAVESYRAQYGIID